MRRIFPWGISRKHLKHKNAHGDCAAAIAKAAAAVTHVQSVSQVVGSGDEGLGFFCLDLSSAETGIWWLGEEQEEESKPIHDIDLGTWLQWKLDNLCAAPDELDHACREAREFASHFRVSCDIFLFIMEATKPVFSVCTHDGGCAYFAVITFTPLGTTSAENVPVSMCPFSSSLIAFNYSS